MAWQIEGLIGPEGRPGYDATGWLWELRRGTEARRVLVEIARTALASERGNADDTVEAIRTEGRSEVERVAAMDDPPRVITCSTAGCRDIPASELS